MCVIQLQSDTCVLGLPGGQSMVICGSSVVGGVSLLFTVVWRGNGVAPGVTPEELVPPYSFIIKVRWCSK